MAVALPLTPRLADVTPRLVQAGGTVSSILNGPTQKLLRLGDRWALDVAIQSLRHADAAALLGARLVSETEGDTLTMLWPQPQFTLPAGLPKANGAGQAGAVLAMKGLTPRLFIPAFAFFSFIAGGRHYLHCTTRAGAVAADGTYSPTIAPMLRRAPADSEPIEFAEPVIEGFVSSGVQWTLQLLRHYGSSFTLTENE